MTPSTHLGSLGLLALGLLACASSVIFIKASHLEPVLLSALRLWIAVAVLLPLFLRDLRVEASARDLLGLLRGALLPGTVLAIHFITWIVGARLTPAVNASLIVNLVPIVTPVWLFVLLREQISKREVSGTLIALGGVGILQGGGFRIAQGSWVGDAVCFVSMLLFALYLVLGRRERSFESLWLYVVPLYAVAALVCSGVSLCLEAPLSTQWSVREIGLAIGLGVIPTVVGHSILNRSMQILRGQLVGVANLSQPVYAAALAYVLLGEVPAPESYVASGVVLGGVFLTLRGGDRT